MILAIPLLLAEIEWRLNPVPLKEKESLLLLMLEKVCVLSLGVIHPSEYRSEGWVLSYLPAWRTTIGFIHEIDLSSLI